MTGNPAAAPRHRAPEAAALAGALTAAGTRLLFGVPGGGPNLDVIGAAAATGLPFVLAHGETAATIMAATCADLTGAPGAAVVTRGPGLTSAVNGIAHAALDRLPVLIIADTVPAGQRHRISHQRLDQEALGRPVAKAVVTIGAGQPDTAAARAVQLALTPPAGPVIVNVDPSARTGLLPDDCDPDPGADGHDLGPLAAALQSSRRPVLICGPGAIPHTAAVRSAVAGRGLPVLHTYRARGVVPDTADEAAGLVTGGTMEWPLLAAADLIIGLGVDPAEMIPAAWDYAAPALLITEVPAESGRYFAGGTELVAQLPAALEVIAANGSRHTWPPGAGRAARTGTSARVQEASAAAPGLLSPAEVVLTVREHTPPETIAAVDAGAHMLVAMPLWEVTEPRRLLISSGLATMGFALPAAIAAALCTQPEPVIAFTGDGGLGMTVMEIETAVRFRLRIVVVVFNDSALSLTGIKQRPAGQGGPEAVSYGRTSFAAVATALGAAGACVTDTGELVTAVKQALDRDGPTVIDAHVDPSGYPAILDLSRGRAGRGDVPPRG